MCVNPRRHAGWPLDLDADRQDNRAVHRRLVAAAFGALLAACAHPEYNSQRNAPDPDWKDGVRQKPLTAEEVTQEVNGHLEELQKCFSRERLNASAVSAYTFRMEIPNDGSPPKVALVSNTPPPKEDQLFLVNCLSDVLRRIKFPAHVGEKLKIDVPIQP
jgi:hypothetical protein